MTTQHEIVIEWDAAEVLETITPSEDETGPTALAWCDGKANNKQPATEAIKYVCRPSFPQPPAEEVNHGET